MKSIEKARIREQEMIEEYNQKLEQDIEKALQTMSVNKMIKVIDSLNKIENVDSKKLSQKEKETEWNKIESLFQKEIERNEKKNQL